MLSTQYSTNNKVITELYLKLILVYFLDGALYLAVVKLEEDDADGFE